MGNATQNVQPVFENSLPSDLREWIDPHTLARAVLAAVNHEGPRSSKETGSISFLCPHTGLTLLAYCYACGIYSSHDIEFRSREDDLVRHFCAGSHPEAPALRRFRRHHRQSVRHCLAEVLHRAWQIHLGIEGSDPETSTGWGGSLHDWPTDCNAHFLEEADERISWAVRRDCWDFDC